MEYPIKFIKFMKKCEKENLTIYQAFERCVVEIEHPLKIMTFRKKAIDNGIIFFSPSELDIRKINLKIINYIESNIERNIYELRDDVIINFKKDVKLPIIRVIIKNFKIRNNGITNK